MICITDCSYNYQIASTRSSVYLSMCSISINTCLELCSLIDDHWVSSQASQHVTNLLWFSISWWRQTKSPQFGVNDFNVHALPLSDVRGTIIWIFCYTRRLSRGRCRLGDARDRVGNFCEKSTWWSAHWFPDHCENNNAPAMHSPANTMAWQWAETLVEIRGTLADIRGTTK